MPYRSSGARRNNVQFGVGRSIWTGAPPPAIPEQVLDGIPGFLAWLALLLAVAGAVLNPRLVINIAALLAVYSAGRFIVAAAANVVGLRLIRRWSATDWQADYVRRAGPDSLPRDSVRHVVIIPAYKEPPEVLARTLEALSRQEAAAQQMIIVLAMEAADPTAQPTAETLIQQFHGRFAHLFYTIHPKGLPGEMQCKSANEAWAARWVRRRVDELGLDLDCILVTTMDSDTLWHPNHFACLTTLFALNPNRHLRFWQAPIRYHNNIWDVHPAMALVHAYSSAWELAYLAARWWIPLPMSSYALSMRLLDGIGSWDSDVIADEWHMFIKAYFQRDGRVKLERIFLPFSGAATAGTTFWDSVKNRYQQTLRHAWGSKEVGFTLARIIERPELRFWDGFRLLLRVAHDIIMAGAGWIVMTVGPQAALLLHPSLFATDWNTPVFLLFQVALAVVSILGVAFWIVDMRLRPPRPRPWAPGDVLLTLISFPLLPVLSLIFLAIPAIHGQTLLLLGMPIQFKVTRKV